MDFTQIVPAAVVYPTALAEAEQRIRDLTAALALANASRQGRPQALPGANALDEACAPDENPNPVVSIGTRGQQLYANAAARQLGRSLPRAEQVAVQRQLRAGAAAALADEALRKQIVTMGDLVFSVSAVPRPALGYVHLYFTDITEQEAIRQEMHGQQTFMQQVLDTIPSMVYVRNDRQKLVFQNQAMQALVAASPFAQPEALLPASVAAQELAQNLAIDAQVLATGEEVTSEDSLTLADGTVNWFYTVKRPLHLPNGTTHVLGISTNITALKQVQHTLATSEKRYRDLMHYGHALIGTCNMQGITLSVNPSLAKLLNEDLNDMPGKLVSEHMPPEDQDFFPAYLARIAAAGEDEGVLRVQPLGSQEMRYLLYHNFVVREPDQEPYIISHAHDITERVLASKEMKKAKLAAEAAVHARENFLANMSHEIRTPMNGVLGVASLLAKTPLTAQQQEYLAIIRSSGQHLLAVLNDVLDMAKISSGKLEFHLEPFNLCDSLGQVVHPLALQAQEKGIDFEATLLRGKCPYPMVQADAHRLNQIVINLLSNAIKFTPAGGKVQLLTELLTETPATITVRFRVTDTGIGMKPEVLGRIFENFTQAYADTARQFGGTGLGLSISRALVEQMGGRLTVESQPEVGSTFTFALTVAKALVAPTPPRPLVGDPNALRGMRALLVEDNDINRMVAAWTMQGWGVEVVEAVDGPEAVRLFGQQAFDIVLMDIQMPGMNGLEATALLRQHPEPPRARTPVLALTANAFKADQERYLAAGLDDSLAKPFEDFELYAKLIRLRAGAREAEPAPDPSVSH